VGRWGAFPLGNAFKTRDFLMVGPLSQETFLYNRPNFQGRPPCAKCWFCTART
jgi:hypothetical protein